MKSAYEIAMERLQKEAPSVSLTEEQKREIADLESQCRAKIAEQELFLGGEMAKAQSAGQLADAASLQMQLAHAMTRIREDFENRKERVRQARG